MIATEEVFAKAVDQLPYYHSGVACLGRNGLVQATDPMHSMAAPFRVAAEGNVWPVAAVGVAWMLALHIQ